MVHDSLAVTGGAERLFLTLCDMFPEAPIYTSVYRPETTLPAFRERDVRPLWPSRLPVDGHTYRAAFLAIALAFEQLKLADYDLVVSSSSQFAMSAGSGARVHVAYCHTPPRFLWPLGASSQRASRVERAASWMAGPMLRPLDLRAARRVTSLVANSRQTAGRISRIYGRTAVIVHPPVDTDAFRPGAAQREDFYLVVGRLVPYKRFDDAVDTCSRTGRRLVVVGQGREEGRLRAAAGPSVTFAGTVAEAELVDLYSRARAVLLPGDDDWGMVATEANACGCPALGLAAGGNLETIEDGVNGFLYDPAAGGTLEGAMHRLEHSPLDAAAVRRKAEVFSVPAFKARMGDVIDAAMEA